MLPADRRCPPLKLTVPAGQVPGGHHVGREAQPKSGSVSDLIGRVLRKGPYAAAVVTSLLLLMIWDAGRRAFTSDGDHSWLTWVALAFVAYGVGVALVFVPRYFVPRARGWGLDQLAWLRWAFAISPFMIAFGLWAAGADRWVATAGLVVSVLLVFIAAKELANGDQEVDAGG